MGGQLVHAAGGAVWRISNGDAEVAIVHRPRHDDWSLPKGKAIRREHPLATACREVTEETGIHPVLGPRLATQRYRSAAGPKVVHYWAMSGRDGTFTPNAEVDQAAWLPIPEARALLTYRRDRAVLDRLARAIAVDAVVLLVRHVSHHSCRRGEHATARGCRQTRWLCHILPSFAPTRLLCVPGTRRRNTLTPLATLLGLPLEPEGDLSDRRRGGVRRIRDLAAGGGTTVLAAPGSAIRTVMTTLSRDDRVTLPGVHTGKGGVWALFFRDARLASADYYSATNEGYLSFR